MLVENKAFKDDGSPCRLPIAGHGLFLRTKHRDNLRRTSRAGEHRRLLHGRDGVTYWALLCVVTLLAFAAVPVSAQSPHTVTVSMRPSKGARTVVAVKLNGAGPYDFMVDTGATVTVVDTALFNELGLPAEGSSRVTSSAGVSTQIRSVVKEVAVDCLSAQKIVVVSMKSPVAGSDYRAVRGILGENFLRHFDILFDNQHRKMTLDAVGDLADSLAGERLPIRSPPLPGYDEDRYRPMISVTVEASGQASLLLDSAATELILLRRGNQWKGFGDTRVTTVNGRLTCESTTGRVFLGKETVSYLPMVSCQGASVKASESEGLLPTAIFKQIFISHAGSYAIVNPAKRSSVPAELAIVTPGSQ
jgi:predicted aspartyl protease